MEADKSDAMTWGQAFHVSARFVLAGASLAVVVALLRLACAVGGAS